MLWSKRLVEEQANAYREFAREQTLRFERFMRELAQSNARLDRRFDELVAELRAEREETRRRLEQLDAKTDEVIAETRAGRQALLAIIDRLHGGTAPAT